MSKFGLLAKFPARTRVSVHDDQAGSSAISHLRHLESAAFLGHI